MYYSSRFAEEELNVWSSFDNDLCEKLFIFIQNVELNDFSSEKEERNVYSLPTLLITYSFQVMNN